MGLFYEMDNKLLIVLIVLAYLVIINIVGFAAMGIDKSRAIKNKWRIPEATLMTIGAIGGALGSICGMKVFRHKTLHKKFTIGLPLLLILHIVILVFCFVKFYIIGG